MKRKSKIRIIWIIISIIVAITFIALPFMHLFGGGSSSYGY
ncbi:MAG: hypothetical protein QF747_00695 [Patescibacteria group bacterium]|nr:hypothetical protein [Patescibacteria group bacterium]|tara:strand:+ start:1771 stop:1893 length:123 start_codon:yes stop_codon:yes gene_type:complete